MFTSDERRALLLLALLGAAGGVLRALRPRGEAPGAPLVAPGISGDDLARQAEAVRRATLLARPLRPGERVDVDRAPAEELERLPRVGTELARRIAADRAAHGPFGSLEALGRVPGIGPGMLRELERTASFSGVPAVTGAAGAAGAAAHPRAGSAEAGTPAGRGGARRSGCEARAVSVNRASAAELDCLPGIGPALAERIVADRAGRGPFREVKDLERVPGIGPKLAQRLAARFTVP